MFCMQAKAAAPSSSWPTFLNVEQQIELWIHKNPTAVKVLKVAFSILGIGLLGSSCMDTRLTKKLSCKISLRIAGTLVTLASGAALLALDAIVPPHHDMKNHAFKPNSCEGGKLYYEGEIPILALDADNPRVCGAAQGYLCGEAISNLAKRFGLVLHTIARQPRASNLTSFLNTMKENIPKRYMDEMEGLLEGYERWAQENCDKKPKHMTFDDIFLFHFMPDSIHFQPKNFKMACAAIVSKNQEGELVFARNMDWPSLGIAGSYSLIINRRYTNEDYLNTVEVCTPGFVGTLTGMNEMGLAIGMNVCEGNTKEAKGIPACIYNRMCLDTCKNTDDVRAFIEEFSPFGPYHLTVADTAKKALSIHFAQAEDGSDVIREYSEKPLATLNCRYGPAPSCDLHHSKERQEVIDQFFEENVQEIERVLELLPVNNVMTTHRVVMIPERDYFGLALDNAFAGKEPLHNVTLEKLFD